MFYYVYFFLAIVSSFVVGRVGILEGYGEVYGEVDNLTALLIAAYFVVNFLVCFLLSRKFSLESLLLIFFLATVIGGAAGLLVTDILVEF